MTRYTIHVEHPDYGDSYSIMIAAGIERALAECGVEDVSVEFVAVVIDPD